MIVCADIQQCLLYVEEFWDILPEDFQFWDAQGRVLTFEKSFLDNPQKGINYADNFKDARQMRSLMIEHLRKAGQALNDLEEALTFGELVNLIKDTVN